MVGVSRFARRRSSISSFVTIALDDVAVMPARMSASRVPQPTQKPNSRPTPKLIAMRVPPEMISTRALPKNSSWSNSSPRLKSRKMRPKIAMNVMSADSKLSGNQVKCGLAMNPTSM